MRLLKVCLLFLVLCLLTSTLLAQTVTGTLSGRVTDKTGAVVPKAKIAIRGEQTGLVREGVTNDEGYYSFTFVPIGRYVVTVAVPGFNTVRKTGVEVVLNTTTTSDFTLQPAATAITVDVTGEVPLVETTSSDIKDTFSTRVIEDRPLPTRSFLTLAETVPGFQDNAVSGQNNPTASSGSSANFNGVGTRGTTFQINGVNNDDTSENQNRQNVNVSSIAEVQVLTNNYSAEFGRGYGAVVLIQTKQGTNNYHGDLFWYEINSPTGFANTYYGNYAGTKLTAWRRHDYGGTIGGPIKSNKLFFFGSYEGVRNGGGRMSTYSILLPNERTPDPSVTNTADRAFIQSIIDRFPAVDPNTPNLCPGPTNVTGSLDGVSYSLTAPCRVYTMPINYSYPAEDISGRTDWNVDTNNSFTARYQWSRQQTMPGTDWIKGQAVGYDNTQQNLGLTLTHIFSNVQTGEFRLAVGRRATQANVSAGNDTPIFRFGGTYGSIIGNAGNFPILRYQTDWQFVYNHRYEASPKLTLRFGTDMRPFGQLNDLSDNYTRGYWSMGSQGWVQTAPGNHFEYHDGYWNFLRGNMVGGSFSKGYGPARLANRLNEENFYAQADYRARPSLTLNFGLRNEYVSAVSDAHHLIDYGYDATNAIEPRVGFAWSPQSDQGLLSRFTGGPGKTVVRGGFGMSHGRWFQSAFSQGGASIRFNPPNAAYIGFTMTSTTNIADPTGGFVFTPGPATGRVSITEVDPNLTLPYAEQWNLTLQRELPAQTGLTVAYVGNRGIGLPFFNMLNRAQFPFVAPSADQWSAAEQASGTAARWAGVSFDCIDPNLASTTPISPAPGHQCISISQMYTNYRRPNERYGGIYQVRNGSWSYYNALQVLVNKRPTHGVNFQAAYTYAKALDTGSELTYMGIDSNYPYLEGDTAASMKGYSLFDTRHRFTVTYGYDLPFYKTQQGILGRFLGGWTLSGTSLFATGNPFTITVGYDLNADGVGMDRPDVVDPSVYGRSMNDGHYIPGTKNTVSTTQIPATAFFPNNTMTLASYGDAFRPGITNRGDEYRNGFRAAGRNNFDLSLTKQVKVREGQSLVLRLDAFNAFNHPQWGYPTQSVTSTSFGQISSQRDNRCFFTDCIGGGARFLQFDARFKF